MRVRRCYPVVSLPLPLCLIPTVGSCKVNVSVNPESLFEARTQQRTAKDGGRTLKKDTNVKRVCGNIVGASERGLPSFQTTLTLTGK